MFLTNLKIRTKLLLNGLVVIGLVLIGFLFLYNNNNNLISSSDDAINKLHQESELEKRLNEHTTWSKKLLLFAINDNKFELELDPKKCEFGKWYYSTEKPEYLSEREWKELGENHRELHHDGAHVKDLIDSGTDKQAAIDYIIANTEVKLANIEKTILDLNHKYEEEADHSKNELHAEGNKSLYALFIIGIIIITLTIIISQLITHDINKPIKVVIDRIKQLQSVCVTNLGDGLQHMAVGDLSVEVIKQTPNLNFNRKDEIGQLADITDSMIDLTKGSVDSYEAVRVKVSQLSDEAKELISNAKDGNLSSRGNDSKFEGEYKAIIKGFNDVLDATITPIEDGGKVLQEIAGGKLAARVTNTYKGDHKKITDNINQLGEALYSVIRDISEAIGATASAATQISSSAEEMAAGSEEQSSQTSEVATAVEQMVATITETARNIVQTNDAVKTTGEFASEGKVVIDNTITNISRIAEVVNSSAKIISELGESSEQISQIIQVINEIADQTNLLALNAAIEAARAGEQGRGFAVVADEVRKLAERTTSATKEIEEMISKIQVDSKEAVISITDGSKEVEKSMEDATNAGNSMQKIFESTTFLSELSNQVAVASEEQSSTVEQIGKSIETINSVFQESSASIQQVAAASTDLSRLAENLQNLVSSFNLESENNYEHITSESSYVNSEGSLTY